MNPFKNFNFCFLFIEYTFIYLRRKFYLGGDTRIYEEIESIDTLKTVVEEYLLNHNQESKQPMPLVMFSDALEHVARIARVLRQPQGNALLLGVGGSGRQSMTKLATYISGTNISYCSIYIFVLSSYLQSNDINSYWLLFTIDLNFDLFDRILPCDGGNCEGLFYERLARRLEANPHASRCERQADHISLL